jgi:hypothetical protein
MPHVIVIVRDKYDGSPYYEATATRHDAARILQRGTQLGFEIEVKEPATAEQVWKFLDTVSGKGG